MKFEVLQFIFRKGVRIHHLQFLPPPPPCTSPKYIPHSDTFQCTKTATCCHLLHRKNKNITFVFRLVMKSLALLLVSGKML